MRTETEGTRTPCAVTELARPWGTITAAATGHGEAVVLLHPLAMSREFWAPAGRALANRFRVITVDARGHGESRWDGTPFSVADLADDVAAVIEELAPEGARVLGMSMGGCVALSLTERRPDLVRALVLADTTADYGPGKEDSWAARAATATGKPRAEQLDFQVDRWFSAGFGDRDPAAVRRVCDIFTATDSRAHAQACLALGEFAGTGFLPLIRCPALVVVGEQDQASPPSMARVLADGIAGAQLQIIPGVRHFSLIEAADQWPALADWLTCGRTSCL
jgi:3-oxoadipate enol-lactonase